jgi:hypothetical protein
VSQSSLGAKLFQIIERALKKRMGRIDLRHVEEPRVPPRLLIRVTISRDIKWRVERNRLPFSLWENLDLAVA